MPVLVTPGMAYGKGLASELRKVSAAAISPSSYAECYHMSTRAFSFAFDPKSGGSGWVSSR